MCLWFAAGESFGILHRLSRVVGRIFGTGADYDSYMDEE